MRAATLMVPDRRAPERGSELERLLDFVDRQLRAIPTGVTRVISVPAPRAEPERLLELLDGPAGFLWQPPAGAAITGAGVCHRFELDNRSGSARFAQLRAEADALWPRLEAIAHPDCAPLAPALVRPRLFGGLAFAAGDAAGVAPPWQGFGAGSFSLPRWRYTRDGGAAALSLAALGGRDDAAVVRRQRLDRLAAVWHGLDADPSPPLRPPALAPAIAGDIRVRRPSRARWRRQVEAIRAAIAAGDFEKIVAAHRFEVDLGRPIDPLEVIRRLADGLRASTRFAFFRDRSVFLGATPERLIARRGRAIETEALAGSIARGEAERLLASAKDRREHELVIEPIVRRLQPLCDSLEVAAQPRIRTLRDVAHLLTPIVGRLRDGGDGGAGHAGGARLPDVVELVEVLHPTPAVGGVPTRDALRWIAEHESEGRGWYAGPIGWLDSAGDGEFAVALRASVLEGSRAYLYAGAGIVADSDPELEYLETELKARSLLDALGVD